VNFLCHALPYMDQPLVAGCTAIPDWLSVIDRRIRARERLVEPYVRDPDPITAAIATGIIRHIQDDRWFHGGDTFTRLNLEFAVALRDALPGDEGFRPTFVGHILIEMLLDANYVLARPELVKSYYQIISQLPSDAIGQCVNRMTGKSTAAFPETIRRFWELQFLYDYATDEGLLHRINQVLGRVGLTSVPVGVLDLIAWARREVVRNHERLLASSDPTVVFPSLEV
jgi:hypothetical protein